MKMPFLVIDSGVWQPLSFIGTLFLQKTRIVECGVVIMGEPVSATITVYSRPISKLIYPSSSVTSNFLQESILSVIF